MTPAELSDRCDAHQLDEQIAEYRRRQVEQRKRDRFWNVYDAGMEDLARAKLAGIVNGGGAVCASCGGRIAPGESWVADPLALAPAYAHAAVDHTACVIGDATAG